MSTHPPTDPPLRDHSGLDPLPSPPVFNSNLPPDPARHEKQLRAIMDIAWAVSSTTLVDDLLPRIMQKVTEIVRAERGTFFVVNRAEGRLWSKVLQGGKPTEIRLPIGEGIAGWVAASGQTVNLADAYEDPRFDRSWDEQSGYRTRALLCVPIHDRNLNVVAVIQCLNKQGRRGFDAEDEDLLRCVSGQCAIALENAFLYDAIWQRNLELQDADARLRRANSELEILYNVERQLSETTDIDALLRDVLSRACSLVKAEAAAILLVNEAGARLFMYRADCEVGPAQSIDARRARELLSHAGPPVHLAFGTETDGNATAAESHVLVPPELQIRETFSAPLSDARTTIGMIQLANRLDKAVPQDWVLRIVSLLASQVARGVVVRRERDAGERAERLALLGHSISAILHDLRTPMTAVGGFSELMAAESDASVRADYVGRIGRALEHMETMTTEVLAFARGKRDVLLQKVYMNQFVDSVRELLLPETSSYGVELVVHAGYDGVARFDESKIKRVIFNLARNACQAMAEGGTFTWTVSREGERLAFECTDTGPGIPKEMEGRLFESFASHGKVGGTGLGLAMAKKIVDAHCGKIECRSTPGHGVTFRIEIPV